MYVLITGLCVYCVCLFGCVLLNVCLCFWLLVCLFVGPVCVVACLSIGLFGWWVVFCWFVRLSVWSVFGLLLLLQLSVDVFDCWCVSYSLLVVLVDCRCVGCLVHLCVILIGCLVVPVGWPAVGPSVGRFTLLMIHAFVGLSV